MSSQLARELSSAKERLRTLSAASYNLSGIVGESEAMAIRSKSLNYNYLTISESTSSLLKVLMIGIVPLAYLGVGIAVVVKRRRMQNEAV